jgi:hypothetical protein
VRISIQLALILFISTQYLSVAAAPQIVEVTAGRGDIRSGPSAVHEIMGEVRLGRDTPSWRNAGSGT